MGAVPDGDPFFGPARSGRPYDVTLDPITISLEIYWSRRNFYLEQLFGCVANSVVV